MNACGITKNARCKRKGRNYTCLLMTVRYEYEPPDIFKRKLR